MARVSALARRTTRTSRAAAAAGVVVLALAAQSSLAGGTATEALGAGASIGQGTAAGGSFGYRGNWFGDEPTGPTSPSAEVDPVTESQRPVDGRQLTLAAGGTTSRFNFLELSAEFARQVRTLAIQPDAEPADAAALAANGIPAPALRAYQAAADSMAQQRPDCRLDWALLAGIGRVETNHGRFGGAVMTESGVSTPHILGPRLDGSLAGTMVIRDTDGGALDADPAYDRAVGQMQFLPGTWRGYASDGDGDGVRNPHDIDDSALAAARYLCSGAGGLDADPGASIAVRRYNNSAAYVTLVLALAVSYRTGTPVVLPAAEAPAPEAPAPEAPPVVEAAVVAPPVAAPVPTPTAPPVPSAAPPAPPAPPVAVPVPSVPVCEPSAGPSAEPSVDPSAGASATPDASADPSVEPSADLSVQPITEPSVEPSEAPTVAC